LEEELRRIKARRVVLAEVPKEKATLENFRLEEVPVPKPGPGQLLLKTIYLSIDPYMRGRMGDRATYAPLTRIGEVMQGEVVAEVVTSNNKEYWRGEIVTARIGWQTHAISDGKDLRKLNPDAVPISTGLGVLGMTGFTAYVGMKVIGQPKPGETVVVSSAAGAVGSVAGQLAKRAGARVVGIAGGPKKVAYVRDELGFDAAVDHHAPNFAELLREACPKGVDVYFENVGGKVWAAVMPLLNRYARVPVSGLVSQYSEQDQSIPLRVLMIKGLTVRAFLYLDFMEKFPEFLREVDAAVRTGGIRYSEDVVEGLENAPAALLGLLEGKYLGKVLVRISK
jgi:NADPH-dependent curcumin reductase CurA